MYLIVKSDEWYLNYTIKCCQIIENQHVLNGYYGNDYRVATLQESSCKVWNRLDNSSIFEISKDSSKCAFNWGGSGLWTGNYAGPQINSLSHLLSLNLCIQFNKPWLVGSN